MPLHGDVMSQEILEEILVRPPKRRRISDGLSVSPFAHNSTQTAEEAAESERGNEESTTKFEDAGTNIPIDGPTSTGGRAPAYVRVVGPSQPNSAFEGWTPPAASVSEDDAISTLAPLLSPDGEFSFFELDNFTVYRTSGKKRALDMVSLEKLQTMNGANFNDSFSFEGMLSIGDRKLFVQGITFSVVAVEGYGDPDCLDLEGKISIQSRTASRRNLWYRLGKPSPEYRRFHERYLWVAMFAKLFVDYLLEHEKVSLRHFRKDFHDWLLLEYCCNAQFRHWQSECGLTDFCTTIAAHVGYLYKECYSISDSDAKLTVHPLWKEVDSDNLMAIPEQQNLEENTVVTPMVFEMFRRMYFGVHLKETVPCGKVQHSMANRKRELCLTPYNTPPTAAPSALMLRDSKGDTCEVSSGDVVCIRPDDARKTWRSSTAANWFAYVQGVREEPFGVVLDVLYLYEPSDTTVGGAYYPFRNELFFSDNCACGKDAVPFDAAVGKVNVAWFVTDPKAVSNSHYFVRQKFRTSQEEDTNDFITLRATDFTCSCRNSALHQQERLKTFRVNQTVLVREKRGGQDDGLTPARIVEIIARKRKVRVKKLPRVADGPPNELVESLELSLVPLDDIIRECHVEYFETRHEVFTPYDRDGAGDFFYLIAKDRPAWLRSPGPWRIEHHEKPPLTGLGLFCGGGNFDRGLEEGGFVKFRYAVDWAKNALHSYRANVEEPESTEYFLGSVNDYLAKALCGSTNVRVATVNAVTFISAGSPCPGFSRMQQDTLSHTSLRNASMVASVIAHVDLYSPKYLILENVVSMTQGMGVKKDENVFAQIVAALVALGYQVQQFLIDAWSYGSSQQRSRVFIIASAPGSEPLIYPAHSHDHPLDREFRKIALGKATNGLPFGKRHNDMTVFCHTTPKQATADLPDIGDAVPQICVRFPDHLTPLNEGLASRERIARIPLLPYETGIEQAVRSGAITSGEAFDFHSRSTFIRKNHTSRSYSRVSPNALFPTMLTKMTIACGMNGRALHWEQPRTLTIMEARRAQGFLDHEVIVGTPTQKMMIVGNSVDRKAAFVLGLALRKSWLARWDDDDGDASIEPENDEIVVSREHMSDSMSPDELTDSLPTIGRPRAESHRHQSDVTPQNASIAIRHTLGDELVRDDVIEDVTRSATGERTRSTSTQLSRNSENLFRNRFPQYETSSASQSPNGTRGRHASERHGLLTPAKGSSNDKRSGSGMA